MQGVPLLEWYVYYVNKLYKVYFVLAKRIYEWQNADNWNNEHEFY